MSEAGEQYVAVASTRGFVVAKPPRWKPLVLQRTIVPLGAVNVFTSSEETALVELLLLRIGGAHRIPGIELGQLSAAGGAGDELERAGACIDVDEVQERLQQITVIEVPMPVLRLDAIGRRRDGHGVPEVDVLELRPHAEIGVREPEHAIGQAGRQPGSVDRELRPPRVATDEVVLRLVPRIRALGPGEELTTLVLDFDDGLGADEVGEGKNRIVVAGEIREHALLDLVERVRMLLETAPGRSVGERAVMELVRRDDPAEADRLRLADEARAVTELLRHVRRSLDEL